MSECITDLYGSKVWYKNDLLHRDDGPAIESANGGKQWYKNGKLHRDDGPARIWADGKKEWWINGDKYSESEFLTKAQPVKELTVADIEKLLGHKVKVVK